MCFLFTYVRFKNETLTSSKTVVDMRSQLKQKGYLILLVGIVRFSMR